jgi:hypothetical protein
MGASESGGKVLKYDVIFHPLSRVRLFRFASGFVDGYEEERVWLVFMFIRGRWFQLLFFFAGLRSSVLSDGIHIGGHRVRRLYSSWKLMLQLSCSKLS